MTTKKHLTCVVVPGTFDPITNGHLDVITRASQMFERVVVGVAVSKNKRGGPTFSLEERIQLVKEATGHLEQVEVKPVCGLLVDFAAEVQAGAVIKGLRALTDFEYEFQQAAMNYHLNQEIETIFIMPSPDYSYLSSSIVRELAELGGSYEQLVPKPVADALKKRYPA